MDITHFCNLFANTENETWVCHVTLISIHGDKKKKRKYALKSCMNGCVTMDKSVLLNRIGGGGRITAKAYLWPPYKYFCFPAHVWTNLLIVYGLHTVMGVNKVSSSTKHKPGGLDLFGALSDSAEGPKILEDILCCRVETATSSAVPKMQLDPPPGGFNTLQEEKTKTQHKYKAFLGIQKPSTHGLNIRGYRPVQ